MSQNTGGVGGIGGAGGPTTGLDDPLTKEKVGDNGKNQFKKLKDNGKPPADKGSCTTYDGLWWTGVAFAIAGLVIGGGSLLAYLKLIPLPVASVGTISMATLTFYTTLISLGVSFVLGVVLAVASCLCKPKDATPAAPNKSSWWDCLNCCEKDPKKLKNA